MGSSGCLLVVYQDSRGDLNFRYGHVDEGSDPTLRAKLLFFLILLLPFRIPLVNSAPDEGYGEANENLGQFTDTFMNETYVAVLSDVIVNTTLECVELKYTAQASKLYENFTEYTEVDVGADRIQRTDFHIDHKAYRNEITYLYYNKGVDYFNDFEHQFQARSDFAQTLSNGVIWMLANDLGDGNGLRIAGKTYISIDFYRGSTANQIVLREAESTVWYNAIMNNPVANTWYYFTVKKIGTDLACEIYDDAPRTNLLANLTLTLQADHSFRYIYGCNTFNVPSANFHNNDIEYFWLGDYEGGFETDGYCLTEDYLNETQGNSLTLLTNASLPAETEITVQFSSDNVTWVDNHGNEGSSTVRANFSALDLRDLNYSDIFMRFNLSGPGGEVTPRLYQSRIVTTNGTAGGVPGPGVTVIESDAPWIALAIILSIIALLLGWGYKR